MSEESEDQWLYGSNPPPPEDVAMAEPPPSRGADIVDLKNGKEIDHDESGDLDGSELQINENGDKADAKEVEEDDGEGDVMLEDIDDDSDDDVNVVIGEIAAPTSYTGFKIGKAGGGTFSTPQAVDKKAQGNFAVNEFDGVGTINGVPANEFNLDSLEDKPWRKPGADLTDYFNYGFNEDTWRAYCERQKRMRLNESGTGIANLPIKPFQTGSVERHVPKAVPPPVRRYQPTSIDVIGATAPSRRYGDTDQPPPATDFSLPPPMAPPSVPSYSAPPPGFGAYQPPPVQPPPAAYYEPQYAAPAHTPAWNNPPPPQAWPAGATPPALPPPVPAPDQLLPSVAPPVPVPEPYSPSRPGSHHAWSPDREPPPPPPPQRERERERDRGDRDRERERESSSRHHRRRSRSRSRERSRRHRSRSRSPSHRHSRKKNKKKDKDSSD